VTEPRAVTHSHSEPDQEERRKEETWKLLSEAGLVDIRIDDFPERIKEAKDVVLRRLTELLEATSALDECQSAAYSLGTLRQIETTLGAPLFAKPMRAEEPDE
jgi:hypothetical protein